MKIITQEEIRYIQRYEKESPRYHLFFNLILRLKEKNFNHKKNKLVFDYRTKNFIIE